MQFGRTLFDVPQSAAGGEVSDAALQLVQLLKQRHYHTDTASFSLRCGTCGELLVGEKGATAHAMKTSHAEFHEGDT